MTTEKNRSLTCLRETCLGAVSRRSQEETHEYVAAFQGGICQRAAGDLTLTQAAFLLSEDPSVPAEEAPLDLDSHRELLCANLG